MEFLTGPASALVLAITLLSGLYRLAAKYLPALIDRHIKLIDDMQESQQKLNEKLDSVAHKMKPCARRSQVFTAV